MSTAGTGATDAQIEAAAIRRHERITGKVVDACTGCRIFVEEQIPAFCPTDHRLIGPDVRAAIEFVIEWIDEGDEFEDEAETADKVELCHSVRLIREAIR